MNRVRMITEINGFGADFEIRVRDRTTGGYEEGEGERAVYSETIDRDPHREFDPDFDERCRLAHEKQRDEALRLFHSDRKVIDDLIAALDAAALAKRGTCPKCSHFGHSGSVCPVPNAQGVICMCGVPRLFGASESA